MIVKVSTHLKRRFHAHKTPKTEIFLIKCQIKFLFDNRLYYSVWNAKTLAILSFAKFCVTFYDYD